MRAEHRRLIYGLLCIALCCAANAIGANRWQSLLDRDPFIPYEEPKPPAAEPPPPYEFRGRSLENGVEYFSLYNLETKKAFWVSATDGSELSVQAYDPVNGLVLNDQAGRIIRLALKTTHPNGLSVGRLRPGTALASAPSAPVPSTPAVQASTSETQRLEQIVDQIRERRTQRTQATMAKI